MGRRSKAKREDNHSDSGKIHFGRDEFVAEEGQRSGKGSNKRGEDR